MTLHFHSCIPFMCFSTTTGIRANQKEEVKLSPTIWSPSQSLYKVYSNAFNMSESSIHSGSLSKWSSRSFLTYSHSLSSSCSWLLSSPLEFMWWEENLTTVTTKASQSQSIHGFKCSETPLEILLRFNMEFGLYHQRTLSIKDTSLSITWLYLPFGHFGSWTCSLCLLSFWTFWSQKSPRLTIKSRVQERRSCTFPRQVSTKLLSSIDRLLDSKNKIDL